MLNGIECLGHSTIRINNNGEIIYIDPFKINGETNDADIIFVTHNHYDHFSLEDINKVRKENTIIVVTKDLCDDVVGLGFEQSKIIYVKPNQMYSVCDIFFQTVPAYNINKSFHPKENDWVGYVLKINNIKYYIAGDTDITEENKKVKCDVAFVPVGGTYTMTAEEAAELVNIIKPKVAVPIHYGSIVGTEYDAKLFRKLIEERIDCEILIK